MKLPFRKGWNLGIIWSWAIFGIPGGIFLIVLPFREIIILILGGVCIGAGVAAILELIKRP